MSHLDSFLCIALLHHTDDCIGNQNEQDHGRFDECGGLVFALFQQGQHEGDDSRDQEDDDELVFELLEDEFP